MTKQEFTTFLTARKWDAATAERTYELPIIDRNLSMREWTQTFVGAFLSKHHDRTHILTALADYLDKPIPQWTDLTRATVVGFRDHLLTRITPNSCHVYMRILGAILSTYSEEEGLLPSKSYKRALAVKETPSQHIALTEEEIERIHRYTPRSQTERDVKRSFLIECYTGMRSIDVRSLSDLQITDNWMTYVSQKTKTETTIPVHRNLLQYLREKPAREHGRSSSIYALQNIARRCGIDSEVELFVGGRKRRGKKYEFLGQHSARRSFASNLALRNVPIPTIAKLMGNTPEVAERYICIDRFNVGDNALAYFQ